MRDGRHLQRVSGQIWKLLGVAGPIVLISCQAGLLLLFARRWDEAAALTVIPFFAYAAGGLVAALGCLFVFRNGISKVAALIWLVTLVTCPDEVAGLVRVWKQKPQPGVPAAYSEVERPLRVITLNCRKREVKNLEQIAKWQPDIVLLQESPYRTRLKKFADECFGEGGGDIAMPSWDCAIIARGRVTIRKTPHYFAQAKVELPGGPSVEVVSLHLHGATTSLSLHKKKTRHLHRVSRHTRMAQVSNILQSIKKHGAWRPCIIGGDFNSPAGDPAYAALKVNYADSFGAAGRGWGNTVMNRYPVHRIDQIWASSSSLEPVRSCAVATEYSDHRMVVSDFVWRDEP